MDTQVFLKMRLLVGVTISSGNTYHMFTALTVKKVALGNVRDFDSQTSLMLSLSGEIGQRSKCFSVWSF